MPLAFRDFFWACRHPRFPLRLSRIKGRRVLRCNPSGRSTPPLAPPQHSAAPESPKPHTEQRPSGICAAPTHAFFLGLLGLSNVMGLSLKEETIEVVEA